MNKTEFKIYLMRNIALIMGMAIALLLFINNTKKISFPLAFYVANITILLVFIILVNLYLSFVYKLMRKEKRRKEK